MPSMVVRVTRALVMGIRSLFRLSLAEGEISSDYVQMSHLFYHLGNDVQTCGARSWRRGSFPRGRRSVAGSETATMRPSESERQQAVGSGATHNVALPTW